MKSSFWIAVALTAFLSLACGAKENTNPEGQPAAEKQAQGAPEAQPVQIANPASVNCVQKGGKLEILDSPEGQYGMCTLPDGTRCEEWALFRGECPPAQK